MTGVLAPGLSVRELARQALSSVEGGYDCTRIHRDDSPLTALGRREDGSPRYRLVLARRASRPATPDQL